MTDIIAVSTAPSEDYPGTLAVTVSIGRGGITTIIYAGYHPTDTPAMRVQGPSILSRDERVADLEEQLRTVTAAAAAWARRAEAAERDRHELRETLVRRQRATDLSLAEWHREREALHRQLAKLQTHLEAPDFAHLLHLRLSEMSQPEREDALEGWLRAEVRMFDPLVPNLQTSGNQAGNIIEFLLQRIDALRNPPKD